MMSVHDRVNMTPQGLLTPNSMRCAQVARNGGGQRAGNSKHDRQERKEGAFAPLRRNLVVHLNYRASSLQYAEVRNIDVIPFDRR